MKAYKLVRKAKDGKLYPLFIDRKRPYIFGEKRMAEYIPTKGFAPRLGFHCCFIPYAPHLKTELSNGEKRVWIECEVDDFETYDRPESQGGKWILAKELTVLRELPFDEVYDTLDSYGIKNNKNTYKLNWYKTSFDIQ